MFQSHSISRRQIQGSPRVVIQFDPQGQDGLAINHLRRPHPMRVHADIPEYSLDAKGCEGNESHSTLRGGNLDYGRE